MRGKKNKWIQYFGFRNDKDGKLILGFLFKKLGRKMWRLRTGTRDRLL